MPEKYSNIAKKSAAAPTDLLHRRVPLLYSFQIVYGGLVVCIRTNLPLMSKACQIQEVSSISEDGQANAIEVQEEQIEATHLADRRADSFEVHQFGPSHALRMNSGSWFARTPPSLDGVGFAMVTGNEQDQIGQLSTYLRTILQFLDNAGAQLGPIMAFEVFA
jgi:hypothetical protein